jgi:putative peptide zinc metalloprotease protein
LGRLGNVDLQLEIAELEGKIEQQVAKRDILVYDQSASRNREAAKELPEVEMRLEALREQLAEKKEDEARLLLVARVDGTVMPAPEETAQPSEEGDLKKWAGSALNHKNMGAFLKPPALYCQIGDPTKMEAILYVDQDDIEYIRPEQVLSIRLDEIPYRTFRWRADGSPLTIQEVGPEVKYTPRQVSSRTGGELMTKQDSTGVERPLNKSYQALCYLDDPDAKLVQGLRGTAKVYADWQPIGMRIWRYITRTFNFKL